jgi:beta-RFAP synthase
MNFALHVRAPCRLHFGMIGFGHADRPQFGGVGVMVEPPNVEVSITPAAQFAASGALVDRTKRFVEAATQVWGVTNLPPCEIRVSSPPDHVGLGVGTQLGLAIAAGLRRFLRLPARPVEALAEDIGRGLRSAVGTHGFQYGGLIVDAGHVPGQSLGKLARRVAIPEDWRFVLVCRASERGLAGRNESEAFSRLPTVPDDVTRELWRITNDELIPALERRDCQEFGDAVYRYGRLAGECFAAVQGGAFASPAIAGLVESVRSSGVLGVGQSSWGPTVFAICPSETDAEALAHKLRTRLELPSCEIWIARPNNSGAAFS